MSARRTLILDYYTKPGCSLCDKATAVMNAVFARLDGVAIQLRERNIETNAAWFERYKWDIPVLELNGERLFTHWTTPVALERRLRDAASQSKTRSGENDGGADF